MQQNIFDRVLFVGPDMKGKGGIASVLMSYSREIHTFNYVKTNSRRGFVCGLINAVCALLMIFYYKWIKKVLIVHIHGATGKSFFRKVLYVKVANLLGYKVIYHSHGAEFKEYAKRCGEVRVSKILMKCSAVVVLSRSWERYFKDELKLDNVYIINNIVEPVCDIMYNDCETNKLSLLFLGEIGERKGVFDLLEMVFTYREELKDRIILRIGGNGDVAKLHELINKYEVADFVEYVGWVQGEKKSMLLRTSDVIVLPSYNEGLPIFLLEAMSYAKPIISTNVGGIPEIIENGKNGYLFNAGDNDTMYKCICSYLNNRNLVCIHGKNGLEKVVAYYPSTVMEQLESLYKKVLN